MQSVGSCLFGFFGFLGFLVFWFFGFLVFWFFGLCVDSHCRCAKQRLPGTVSGCTRSKVDTLQYSNVCYDIVHSANEQQRGMEFNFVWLRHMFLDLCTGNAAICALPQWPVLKKKHFVDWHEFNLFTIWYEYCWFHKTSAVNTSCLESWDPRQCRKNIQTLPRNC